MSSEEAHGKNLSHLTDLFPQLTEADAAGFYEGDLTERIKYLVVLLT